MGLICSFVVFGTARPQGSTTTWNKRDPRTGDYKPAITHHNRESLMQWRADIRAAIQQQAPQFRTALITGPVAVRAVFYLLKPPSVPKKRVFPIVVPDCDKLARGLNDAIESVLIRNDSQIVHLDLWKVYTADRPMMTVELWEPDALTLSAVGNPFDTQPRLFLAEQAPAPDVDEEPFSETLGDA
jgi:Holliday junction resolvase RusA-like endonuclease